MVETKFKQTDIGLVPEDWEIKTIEEVANVFGGGTPSTRDSIYWNGDINWFTPTEVGKSKYLYDSVRKITEEGLSNCSARILPINTILITTRAGIGDLGILKIPSATNQGFQSLIPNTNIDYEFLYYLVSTLKPLLLKNASGSTFLEISPSKVKSIEIPVPPLPEQKAIAEVLSDTDHWITSLEDLIVKKQLIKQGAMQKLLTPKDDWEVKRLGDLTKVFTKQTGFDYSAYIKPSLVQTKSENDIPFIQNKDFNNKWINLNTDYYIPKNIAQNFPRILLNEKSLLISISGAIGNIGVYEKNELAFIGGAIAILKFKNPEIIDWAMYYLKSREGQLKLFGNVKAGSHQNLILDDIRKIEIPLPKIEEQIHIATILSDMDAEIETLEQKLTKAKQVKQGLMQELLIGRIRLV